MNLPTMVLGATALGVLTLACQARAAPASTPADEQLRRGAYLVGFGGCGDCHTPKLLTPQGPVPDQSRLLAGHVSSGPLPPFPAGVLGPERWGAVVSNDLTAWTGPWGTSFAANLTPDKATGLGAWTSEQFIKTMRTGKHLGVGEALLPPMPWLSLNVLTDDDLQAVFAYLQSLTPVHNPVPRAIPPK